MTDRRFISGDTWEPVVNLPICLNPYTGEWVPIEDLLAPRNVQPPIIGLDELLELTE